MGLVLVKMGNKMAEVVACLAVWPLPHLSHTNILILDKGRYEKLPEISEMKCGLPWIVYNIDSLTTGVESAAASFAVQWF